MEDSMQARNKGPAVILFNLFAYTFILIATALCVLPFLLVISGSLTDNASIAVDGYHFLPKVFSLEAYKTIFMFPQTVIQAYKVTTVNTLVGTALGLFFMSMAGYVLSRKDFKYRNRISFLIYFTTIFGGGLVPWYMMVSGILKLKDSYIAICYPGLMAPFLIILMRTFITSALPDEVVESAKIDGAGSFRTYWSIVLPIVKPGLATVGLFLALNYWNDWFLTSMFITTPSKYELQFYLYNMLSSYEALNYMLSSGVTIITNPPSESIKLAMAIIATGPVLLFYPFIQRYFVAGITVGAVKG
jgi:putative aldouronate transport system permease protein